MTDLVDGTGGLEDIARDTDCPDARELASADADLRSAMARVRVALGTTSRPADVLVRQLQRLVDVREVHLDIVRPSFALPKRAEVVDELSNVAARARRGLSFLGIPERVSVAAGGAV